MNKKYKKIFFYVGASVLVFALLSPSFVGTTLKFGTDGTGQVYFGDTSGLIKNSNGKAWSATASNLQSAIWDLNSTGGTIFGGNNNFDLDAQIVIIDKCDVVLQDFNLTVSSDISGASYYSVFYVKDCFNITFRNIIIDIDKGVQSGELKGFTLNNTDRSFFELVYINGSSGCAYELTLCDYTTIQDNVILDCCKAGVDAPYIRLDGGLTSKKNSNIIIEGNAMTVTSGEASSAYPPSFVRTYDCDENIRVTGNRFYGGWIGVHVYGSLYCIVNDNIFRNQGNYGVTINHQNINNATWCKIVNNNFNRTRNESIRINFGNFTTIMGNTILNCYSNGILLAYSHNCTVNANTIKNCAFGGTIQKAGIYIGGSSPYGSNNIIFGNTIVEDRGAGGMYWGVYFPSGSHGCILMNNNVVGSYHTSSISNSGTNNYVTNNLVNEGIHFNFPTTNATANHLAGYAWFETGTNVLSVYNGTAWVTTTLT